MKKLALVSIFEGLISLFILIIIPVDPKNSIFLGFSLERWVLIGCILLTEGIFITLLFISRYDKWRGIVDSFLQTRWVSILFLLAFLAFVSLIVIYGGNNARNIRLRPVLIYGSLISIQMVIYQLIAYPKIRQFGEDNVFLAILIGVYLFLFVMVSTNISRNPYLWFDEAGQFWISKGLNHYSSPLQVPKGLSDVITNNAIYNLDPGGFSILLHFWAEISNSYLWLRILPFLFFIGTIVSFIYLSYRWTRKINIALIMGFLPFLFSSIVSMGFEIRAYSMEYLGVVLVIVAIDSIKSKLSFNRLFIWGCILSIFITSRYSIINIIFIASIYVVLLIRNANKKLLVKAYALCLFALPIFFTLAYEYFFVLLRQNPKSSKLYYLPYLIDDWRILYTPSTNLYYLLSVVFLVFVLIYSIRRKSILLKYKALIFIAVASNLLFLTLSFWGKYPWSPLGNRGLPYFTITLICFSAIIGEILVYFLRVPSIIKYISIVIIVLFSFYICKGALIWEAQDGYLTCLAKIDFKNYNKIYVDRWANPEIRYLFEYGALKPLADGNYPEKFSFANFPYDVNSLYTTLEEKYMSQPKMNSLLEYDLLITPELYRYGENDKWTLVDDCGVGVYKRK